MPFSWGANDCCAFGADACVAMGLDDPMRGLRGYKTEQGALKKLAKLGGDLRSLVGERLPETPVSLAGRGYVALIPHDSFFGGMIGLVLGDRIVAPGPSGLESYPLATAVAAFRVA